MPKKRDKVLIFDTTLRDGEQSPGASMNLTEKLEVARALERLGVDIIEAGFPAASPGDFEAVRKVSAEVKKPVVAALARCHARDIDAAGKAVAGRKNARIHVFVGTSPLHRKYQLRKSPRQVLKMAVDGVTAARDFVKDVEFSPMDATRTEMDYLCEVVEAAIDAGATTINIPDTVGYATPMEFGEFIADIIARVPNAKRAIISVHCHNDLGLAVANSLAAVKAGARQIECSINGLGERAGNCSLEEVVMGLNVRPDSFGGRTDIKTQYLYPTSRLVSRVSGMVVQRNKAIVGENAFAHESGIHQDGVLKHRQTFEIMRAEDVGFKKNVLVLGKHSGRHAFRERLKELGFRLNAEQIDAMFIQFKNLADRKKEIFDADLEALVESEVTAIRETWRLRRLQVASGTGGIPMATVELENTSNDKIFCDAATGDGPVDAIFQAIERLTRIELTLQDYQLRSVTGGTEAQGEARVEVVHGTATVSGRGVSTDILEASAKAYLNAINRIISRKAKPKTRAAALKMKKKSRSKKK